MINGKFYRITTIVVTATLVFMLAGIEGCGGYVSGGGGNGGGNTTYSITGTVFDDSTTNKPVVAGAQVVLEQPDANGIDRIIASTTSLSDGSFSFSPSLGIYDVVVDATVTGASIPTVTYAATVTFGVPANASLKIPLVPEFGSATPVGIPARIPGTVSSSSTMSGLPVQVDVRLSALQSVSLPAVSVTQLTIPTFAGSTTSITTVSNLSSCTSGTDCVSYALLVPSGNFSFGTFSASGTNYTLALQQPTNVNYIVEGKAFILATPLSQTCTPPVISTPIVIVSGTPTFTNPNLSFTSCL